MDQTCSVCKAPLTPGAPFCPNCGSRVESPPADESSAGKVTTTLRPAADQEPAPSPFGVPKLALPEEYREPAVYGGGTYYAQTQQQSTLAIVSLVFGILGWTALPLIGAIVAIIAGHMGRREIRASGGRLTGTGLTTAGLILGYLQLALLIVGCVAALLFVVVVNSSTST